MPDYSLSDLAALTGLPVRTIRYYIAQGLIPSPGREGPATRYPETTLAALRLIGILRDAHQPLAAIRSHLASLSDQEVVELAAPAAPEPRASGSSALEYVRALLAEDPAQPRPGGTLRALAARHLAEAAPPYAAVPAPASMKPPMPTAERSQWERIGVSPDIEIHVRRPLSRRDNRLVERLLAFARQLQGEDKP